MGDVPHAEDINRQQQDKDVVQSMERLCLFYIRSKSSRTSNNNFIQAERLAGSRHYP